MQRDVGNCIVVDCDDHPLSLLRRYIAASRGEAEDGQEPQHGIDEDMTDGGTLYGTRFRTWYTNKT